MVTATIRVVFWLMIGLALALPRATEDHRTDGVLDEVHADYHEDAPGARSVAAIAARLRRDGPARRLELDVAATGRRVRPVPGFAGIAGTNLRTAEELQRLLRDGALRMAVRIGRTEHGSGRIVAVERASLPTRVLTAAGDVDLHAQTPAHWPARVQLLSDALPPGRVFVELLVDGVSRLRVTVVNEPATARIAAVESLGEVLEVRRP